MAFLGLMLAAAVSAESLNPIVPMMVADPSMCKFGDTYYLYATTDIDRELNEAGVPVVWTSKDFKNWSFEGSVMTGKNWKEKDGRGFWRYWAPGRVIEKDGKYLLYVTIVSPDGKYAPTCVFEAASPVGPWKFDERKPVCSDIDGDVFVDDDGAGYIFWRKRKASKLSADLKSLEGPTIEIKTKRGGYSEGPFMFKRGNKYYYCYTLSGCDTYHYAYMVSEESPLGPFTAPENDIFLETDRETGVIGPGHGNVFKDGDDFYVCYLEYGEGGTTRQVFVDKLEFDAQGNILPVKLHRGKDAPLAAKVTATSEKKPKTIRGRNKNTAIVYGEATYAAGNVADGDNSTRWTAAPGDKEPAITVDFGTVKDVGEVMMFFTIPSEGHSWKLEKSVDGEKWEVAATEKDRVVRSPHIAKVNAKARYLRLTILEGFPGIWELKVRKN